MTTTNSTVIATVRADKNHDVTFEQVWGEIYKQNQAKFSAMVKTKDLGIIAFDLKDEYPTFEGKDHLLPLMAFDVPIDLVLISTGGAEQRTACKVRIEFDATVVKWESIDAFTNGGNTGLPSMFNFGFNSKVGKDGGIVLTPHYSLDKEEAAEFLRDSIFDNYTHAVAINNPQSVRHLEGKELAYGDEIMVVGGYFCIAVHKARLMKTFSGQAKPSKNLESFMAYLQGKSVTEAERIAKVNEKFKTPITVDGKTLTRFDIHFKQRGYVSAKLPNFPKNLPLFKSKMQSVSTMYVSPLIALLVRPDGSYSVIYNLFEESITEASERLVEQKLPPLAKLVLDTDLRSK